MAKELQMWADANKTIKGYPKTKAESVYTNEGKKVENELKVIKTNLDNITTDLNGYSFSDTPSEGEKVLHLQEFNTGIIQTKEDNRINGEDKNLVNVINSTKASIDNHIANHPSSGGNIEIVFGGNEPTNLKALWYTSETIQDPSSWSTNFTGWNDLESNFINAHGAGIMYHNGKYYWYGESKSGVTTSGFIPTTGVNCYSSYDLVDWKFENKVLKPNTNDSTSDIHTSKVIERPKVIYNRKNNNFVMIFHADTKDYLFAKIGIATCNSPTGDFIYQGSYRPNIDSECRDITIFKDDDEKAYIFVSRENNNSMYIHEMNDDYTGFTNNYKNIIPNGKREAPGVWKYNGKYYVITSGLTGWNPNPTHIWSCDTLFGTWVDEGVTCRNDTTGKSYGCQPGWVFKVEHGTHKGKLVAMFDKWVSTNLETSSYLWLPLKWDNSTSKYYVDIQQPQL